MPRKFLSKKERQSSYMKSGQRFTKKKILIPTLTLVMMMFAFGIGPATPQEVLAATTDTYIEMTVDMPEVSISKHETNLVKSSNTQATFSNYWYADTAGNWHIKDGSGNMVTNAWVCDDAIQSNGQNVWYLIDANGNMITQGLVQDQTGNYYSLETNHNGFYGMLRYQSGTYDNIQLTLDSNHSGSFAAIQNQEAIAQLQSIHGLTQVSINNSNCVYTSSFSNSTTHSSNPQAQPQVENPQPSNGYGNASEYADCIPGYTGPSMNEILADPDNIPHGGGNESWN